MTGYTVIEEVKKRLNIKSDNQIANLINKSRQNVSGWKNSGKSPDAETILELMIAGELSAAETKELLKKDSQKGFINLSLVIVTAILMSLIYIGIFNDVMHTLYIMRIKPALERAVRLCRFGTLSNRTLSPC